MRLMSLTLCAALALTACAEKPNRVAFDGVFFRAKASAPRNDRKNFVVVVKRASQSIEGARAAGLYEATKHCIEYYGTSTIDWVVGPDTPPEQLRLDKDTLTFRGTCVE